MKLLNKQWARAGEGEGKVKGQRRRAEERILFMLRLLLWLAGKQPAEELLLVIISRPAAGEKVWDNGNYHNCALPCTLSAALPLCHWTVTSLTPPPASLCCLQSLPVLFIHSFVHHFQAPSSPAPSSIQFSSTHCSCSTRAARLTPALVAFCCHACVYTFTFTFTLRKHHFYATSNAQGFVASTAAAATRRRDGSAKSVAYFAAHLVKLFICPNPLPLLFLSLSLVCLSLSLSCLSFSLFTIN